MAPPAAHPHTSRFQTTEFAVFFNWGIYRLVLTERTFFKVCEVRLLNLFQLLQVKEFVHKRIPRRLDQILTGETRITTINVHALDTVSHHTNLGFGIGFYAFPAKWVGFCGSTIYYPIKGRITEAAMAFNYPTNGGIVGKIPFFILEGLLPKGLSNYMNV